MWQAVQTMSKSLKAFCLLMIVLLIALQWRLWSGDGGLPSVWSLRQLALQQQDENEILAARNKALLAEVNDLRQGQDAVEERARSQLGMIREDEVFYLAVDPDTTP